MIEKILKKIKEFINWPYAVGGKQAIVKKKLINIASFDPGNKSEEKIIFSDRGDNVHVLRFVWKSYEGPLSTCLYVQHNIHVYQEKDLPTLWLLRKPMIEYPVSIPIDLFEIIREGDKTVFSNLKTFSIVDLNASDEEARRLKKLKLLKCCSDIDYDKLIGQLDLLMIKLL